MMKSIRTHGLRAALSWVLTFALALALAPGMALTANADASGTFGTGASWTYDAATKTLTISGGSFTKDEFQLTFPNDAEPDTLFGAGNIVEHLVFSDTELSSAISDSLLNGTRPWSKDIVSIDFSGLDTSAVTNMSEFCMEFTKLASITLGGKFDTSNVTNMESFFLGSWVLTELDLTGFVLRENVNTSYLFDSCRLLKTIKVSESWDSGKIGKGSDMFYDCPNLVGGNGTAYDESHIDKTYAVIDAPGTPGYLTLGSPSTDPSTDPTPAAPGSRFLVAKLSGADADAATADVLDAAVGDTIQVDLIYAGAEDGSDPLPWVTAFTRFTYNTALLDVVSVTDATGAAVTSGDDLFVAAQWTLDNTVAGKLPAAAAYGNSYVTYSLLRSAPADAPGAGQTDGVVATIVFTVKEKPASVDANVIDTFFILTDSAAQTIDEVLNGNHDDARPVNGVARIHYSLSELPGYDLDVPNAGDDWYDGEPHESAAITQLPGATEPSDGAPITATYVVTYTDPSGNEVTTTVDAEHPGYGLTPDQLSYDPEDPEFDLSAPVFTEPGTYHVTATIGKDGAGDSVFEYDYKLSPMAVEVNKYSDALTQVLFFTGEPTVIDVQLSGGATVYRFFDVTTAGYAPDSVTDEAVRTALTGADARVYGFIFDTAKLKTAVGTTASGSALKEELELAFRSHNSLSVVKTMRAGSVPSDMVVQYKTDPVNDGS